MFRFTWVSGMVPVKSYKHPRYDDASTIYILILREKEQSADTKTKDWSMYLCKVKSLILKD